MDEAINSLSDEQKEAINQTMIGCPDGEKVGLEMVSLKQTC